jgi:L-gulonolactone oxidase
VTDASASGQQLKVVGSGHSFSPITLTDAKWDGRALLLNLDNMSSILELPSLSDPSPTVLVEAGIRVYDLNAQLLTAGFALENTGAIAMQSVAGATQTGTHGTGTGLGSMSSQLVGMTLLLSNGTMLNVSATEAPDIFDAARVGLGALGVVVYARLRVSCWLE